MENNVGQIWLIVTSDKDKALAIIHQIKQKENEKGNDDKDIIIQNNPNGWSVYFENGLSLIWVERCGNICRIIDRLWCEKENVSHLLNHNVIFNPKYLDYYKYITLI